MIEIDDRVTSAMVSDSLDLFGVRENVMRADLMPLERSMKIVGIAATAEFAPDPVFDEFDPYADAIDYLDTLAAGEVAVIATGGNSISAFWGELFSTAAMGRGVRGVIVDGPLRDTAQILTINFPAFGVGRRPIDYKGRMKLISTRSNIECSGVQISNGDYIFGDCDGVVVVPFRVAEEVFAAANERARGEKAVLRELQAGKSVREVWDRHRLL